MPKFFNLNNFVILIFTILILQLIYLLLNLPSTEKSYNIKNEKSGHLLCAIFPYRDRCKELQSTLPRLNNFLTAQNLKFYFIVVNQTDIYRFNRAALINIGVVESEKLGCDYIVMHDIDIVPLNTKLNYSFPGVGQIVHLAAGKYHPITRYDYKNFIGGVLLLTIVDYRKVNGMSNSFWGWGLEDDEFFLRLKEVGLTKNISRPINLKTNRSSTFLHIHNKERKRDYKRREYKNKLSKKRDRKSGLNDIKFLNISASFIVVNNIKARIINVKLFCDLNLTNNCL